MPISAPTTTPSKKVEVVGILSNVISDQSVKLLIDSMVADEQNRMQIIALA